MKIGIFGFGAVGQQLALLLHSAGHSIMVGLAEGSASTHSIPYRHDSFAETAAASEAVVLAIPYTACAEVLPPLAELLAGKIIIDNTNPLNPDWSPLLLGQENSASETIQRLLPRSYVVKAFNTIFADVMQADRQQRDGQRITAFVCSDHAEAKTAVLGLAADAGFAPLDVGPLRCARQLESLAHLNIQLAVGQGGGTNAAVLYHRAQQSA